MNVDRLFVFDRTVFARACIADKYIYTAYFWRMKKKNELRQLFQPTIHDSVFFHVKFLLIVWKVVPVDDDDAIGEGDKIQIMFPITD